MLIWLLSAANFVIGMGAFLVIGLITPVSQDLAVSEATAGQLLTVYAMAYAVGSPIAVSLTGALDRRTVLALGMGVFGIASVGCALAPDFGTLTAWRAVAALGGGLVTPVTAAVAAAVTPSDERGGALAKVILGLTVAQATGLPVGSLIGYALGWDLAFWLVAALAAIALTGILAAVPRGLPVRPTRLADLAQALLDGPAMLAVAFTATLLGGVFTLYTYFAPLLEAQMGYGGPGVTLVLVVFGIGAIVGNLGGGAIADRIPPAALLTAVAALQIVLLPLFGFLPVADGLMLSGVLVWSTIGWSFGAAQQKRLVTIWPERAPILLSLNAAAIYVCPAFGSAIGGAAIGPLGPQGLGPLAGAVGVVALVNILASVAISSPRGDSSKQRG